MKKMPPVELPRRELRRRLLSCYSLMRQYHLGAPIEELERRLVAALDFAEAYGHIEFHARKAAHCRDPREYWVRLLDSAINRWPPGYVPADWTKFPDRNLCDDSPTPPEITEAIRAAALAVYDQIQRKLDEYRSAGSMPSTQMANMSIKMKNIDMST